MVDSAWDIKATNFQGKATSAGMTTVTAQNPTGQTSYYPTFVTATGGTMSHRANDGLRYDTQQGTSTVVGRSTLVLGNSTASGTAGNKKGRLALHNEGTGYTWVQGATSSNAYVQTLPSVTGTFVVKQDATITTETNGWYKVNMGAYTHYFKTGAIPSQKYNLNGWGWLSGTWKNLPSGVTYNSAKMIFTGNVYCEDSAILYNWGITNGNTAVNVYYNNKYGGDLTKVGYYNFSLIVFP